MNAVNGHTTLEGWFEDSNVSSSTPTLSFASQHYILIGFSNGTSDVTAEQWFQQLMRKVKEIVKENNEKTSYELCLEWQRHVYAMHILLLFSESLIVSTKVRSECRFIAMLRPHPWSVRSKIRSPTDSSNNGRAFLYP